MYQKQTVHLQWPDPRNGQCHIKQCNLHKNVCAVLGGRDYATMFARCLKI